MADTTPIPATVEAFEQARGDALDGVWAHGVSWALLVRDVEADLVDEGLREALEVVRDTGEPAEELFGPAGEHAVVLYDRWVDEGRLRLAGRTSMPWRAVPSSGLAWSAFFCVAFAVMMWASGDSPRTWTLGMAIIPVGLGLATAAAVATRDALLQRRGTVTGIVGAASAVVALAVLLASANEWSRAHPWGTHSAWWYVPLAIACGLLSTAWRRWTDTWPSQATPAQIDVDEWSRQVAALLRARYSLADGRVRSIIAEAQQHALQSGRSLVEEFGTPEDYAARFAPDLARRALHTMWFHLFLVALSVAAVLAGGSRLNLVTAVGFAWVAWRYHRSYRRLSGD